MASHNGTDLMYVHQDHLSGTSLMTSDNGTKIDAIKYEPFGATRAGDVPTDKKFTGQRLDGTGLYFYNARYYDPLIGRFISPDTIIPDPMNPQSFNRYSYVLNNPLKYVDPSGRNAEELLDWEYWSVVAPEIEREINSWNSYPDDPYSDWLMEADTTDMLDLAGTVPIVGEFFDLLNAGFYASQGDWVNAGLSVSAMVPIVGIAGTGGKVVNKVDNLLSLTKGNFRKNLQRLTGLSDEALKGKEAHHILPINYADDFRSAGIDIHDPKYGAWLDQSLHKQTGYKYNNEWGSFFKNNPNPSRQKIESKAQNMMNDFYGLQVNFK